MATTISFSSFRRLYTFFGVGGGNFGNGEFEDVEVVVVVVVAEVIEVEAIENRIRDLTYGQD
jgi:hypothetical protein